jgi:hypothetical protein
MKLTRGGEDRISETQIIQPVIGWRKAVIEMFGERIASVIARGQQQTMQTLAHRQLLARFDAGGRAGGVVSERGKSHDFIQHGGLLRGELQNDIRTHHFGGAGGFARFVGVVSPE